MGLYCGKLYLIGSRVTPVGVRSDPRIERVLGDWVETPEGTWRSRVLGNVNYRLIVCFVWMVHLVVFL